MERKMKDSGHSWLGEIPEHWKISRVKHFSNIFSGEQLSQEYFTEDKLYPIYGGGDVMGYSKIHNVPKNSLILGRVGGDGQVRHIKSDFWATDNSLIIKTSLNKTYLCGVLNSTNLLRLNTSTSQPLLTASKIKNVPIPVPPLAEQELIAAYLDVKCGEIDELIDVEQQMISDLESYRQAVITETVTHGINPTAPTKPTAIPWISSIPEQWKEIRLKFLSRISTGDKDTIMANDEGEYPFFVRSPKIERINTYSYDGEAILMAGDGVGAGRVFHHFIGKFDWHQRVYNMHELTSSIYGRFLFYFLLANFHKLIDAGSAKSTVDSVRLPMLTNFLVLVPPIEEQREISDYLDAKCTEIDELIKVKQEKIETLKQYRQSLIFEAVTGKTTIA